MLTLLLLYTISHYQNCMIFNDTAEPLYGVQTTRLPSRYFTIQ
jgi:hypothetical protein